MRLKGDLVITSQKSRQHNLFFMYKFYSNFISCKRQFPFISLHVSSSIKLHAQTEFSFGNLQVCMWVQFIL